VPKQLTDEHKQAHMEMCMEFLQQYFEGEVFLQQIVTGDKTWVCHCEPANKCQSVEWKHIITQDQEIQKCAFCW
jgi:hypothetical protein